MDEHEDSAQSCEIQFRQFGAARAFTGEISTVRCDEDNVLLRKQLNEPGHARVLVVDGGGSLRRALMGDAIADLAHERGWSGVIIWGAVRDVGALARVELGIKALGSNPRRSTKNGGGEVDVPVTFGGVTFTPGATVVSDDDGIVVLP
jgi:regulator of ribonuclease activity A